MDDTTVFAACIVCCIVILALFALIVKYVHSAIEKDVKDEFKDNDYFNNF